MPIPASTRKPRVLLREAAYRTIHDAIEDGTLEAGERLLDEQLSDWLGSSRTPIRLALVTLVDEGLVEMRPNRFTRVAERDATTYRDAAVLLDGLHTTALPLLDPAARSGLRTAIAPLRDRVAAQDTDALAAARDRIGGAVATVPNTLLVETERRVRSRARFHMPAALDDVDWTAAGRVLAAV
jgi:DNA-binding GntR family transcriptional regulator